MSGSAVLGRGQARLSEAGFSGHGFIDLILPRFVTQSTVAADRAIISGRMTELDAEFAKCGNKLPAATASAFLAWRQAWEVSKAEESTFWNSKALSDQLDTWDVETKEWQAKIISLCGIDVPQFDPTPADTITGGVNSVSGLVKWGLLAFVVVKAWPLVGGAIEARRAKSAAK